MTKDEASKKFESKVKQIQELAKVLQISITAENTIVQNKFIRPTVIWSDREEYDIETPPVIKRSPLPEKQDDTTTIP